jgi:5-methylcytosine-specific restriction endonuclease McrA
MEAVINTPHRSTTVRDRDRARFRRAQAPCGICGEPIDYTIPWPDLMSFVVDHIKPVDRYPELANDPNNKQAAHSECNRSKSNKEYANIVKRSGSLRRS